MRKLVLAIFIFIAISIAIGFRNTTIQFKPIAVVELFTSQGCSSCPPADRLLSEVIAETKNENIFALSFHVDYWNRLGWADPFSDSKFSERQRNYATLLNLNSVYTPQMIVNGKSEFVGSDKIAMDKAISESLKEESLVNFKTLTILHQDGKPSKLHYELEGNFTDCKVNFALVSLNETTLVKRGENAGKTLNNKNIVREFITETSKPKGEISFTTLFLPLQSNMAIVAYIQQNASSKVIGAAKVVLN